MLQLDFFSMTIVVAVNLMTIAFALPWFMGQKISPAARHAQQFLLLQGLAWLLILATAHLESELWDTLLPLGAAVSAMAALWQLGKALRGWLGPRSRLLVRAQIACGILGPLGFVVLLQSVPSRLAWFSACYGICAALVACMALYPARPVNKSWRYILFGVGSAMGLIMLLRSYLTLQTPWLQSFTEDSYTNLDFAMLAPFSSTLLLVAILIALNDETRRRGMKQHQQDSLTGLLHRHALTRQAQIMLRRAKRKQLALAMVMLNMDHFQRVNDRHGHTVGDEALQLLSRTLQKQMRGEEIAGRWSGETFCLLLHADAAGVRSLYTRLRSAMQLGAQYELQLDLDFSAGCALATEAWDGLSLDELVEQASRALQSAKERGRGRLEIHTLAPPEPAHSEAEPASVPPL